MKKSVVGVMSAVLIGMVIGVIAESEPINPSRITTPQINAYGANPIQINGTNVTVSAAQINAAGDGTTATVVHETVSATTVFKVGQTSTGTFTTAMGPLILNQPVGSVSSNIVTKYLLFQVVGSTNWYSVPAFQCSAP